MRSINAVFMPKKNLNGSEDVSGVGCHRYLWWILEVNVSFLPACKQAGCKLGEVDKGKFFSYHIEEIFMKLYRSLN